MVLYNIVMQDFEISTEMPKDKEYVLKSCVVPSMGWKRGNFDATLVTLDDSSSEIKGGLMDMVSRKQFKQGDKVLRVKREDTYESYAVDSLKYLNNGHLIMVPIEPKKK